LILDTDSGRLWAFRRPLPAHRLRNDRFRTGAEVIDVGPTTARAGVGLAGRPPVAWAPSSRATLGIRLWFLLRHGWRHGDRAPARQPTASAFSASRG
jgi:hypothetical protein